MSDAKPIPRRRVTSSNIEEIGHDAETNTLAVLFKNGGLYHYPNVSADEFTAFANAESHGKHFHTTFRKRGATKIQ